MKNQSDSSIRECVSSGLEPNPLGLLPPNAYLIDTSEAHNTMVQSLLSRLCTNGSGDVSEVQPEHFLVTAGELTPAGVVADLDIHTVASGGVLVVLSVFSENGITQACEHSFTLTGGVK